MNKDKYSNNETGLTTGPKTPDKVSNYLEKQIINKDDGKPNRLKNESVEDNVVKVADARDTAIAKYPPDPEPTEEIPQVIKGPQNTFTYTKKEDTNTSSKIMSFLNNSKRKLFMSLGLITLGSGALKAESGNSAEKSFSDPTEKKTEKKFGKVNELDRDSLIKEYGEVMAGRWSDFKILNKKTEEGKTYKQIFNELGEEYGIAPEILFASTAEEGLRDYLINPFDTKDKVYKVSGFENFGLDHFAEIFPNLVKSKLLESNFDFKQSIHKNEKGITVKSADFKTAEDAIRAKVAIMRLSSDRIVEFADKNDIALSDDALDFFMLVTYNAGFGNATKMLLDYNGIGALDDDSFLKSRPTKGNEKISLKENSWEQPYTNVIRRMKPAEAWKDKGVLEINKVKKLGKDYTNNANTAKVSISPTNSK